MASRGKDRKSRGVHGPRLNRPSGRDHRVQERPGDPKLAGARDTGADRQRKRDRAARVARGCRTEDPC
eukprot:8139885-Alexandrium_andersonii.AAC.1